MNDDGGVQNEPLSLIVIPPANDADVAAEQLTTALDVPDDSPLPSDSLPHTELILAPDDEKDGPLRDHPLIHIDSDKHEEEVLELSNGQAEMLEASPDGTNEAEGAIGDDEQEYLQGSDPNEMKRVKVYELVGARWMDRGTAFCFGHLSEDQSEALLTARSEKDVNEIILTTTIRTSDVYQRQQDTLIVWTEPDGVDYALSFQDPEGCAEVWSFIVDVQRHMSGAAEEQASIALESSSPLIGPEPSLTTASIFRTGHLPTPHMGMITEIDQAIKALARTQQAKERICAYIHHEDYIKHLIAVLHAAEEAKSLENLHELCALMQTILLLNDHAIIEDILEDERFFDVCGMLEYDPEFPHHKANYREFLSQGTRFHSPVSIRDQTIHRKIHHTYRLQFLKDVVLARVLDDSTFNVLNSCIIFNQIDIINHVQQDIAFLKDIVKLYVDEEMLSGGGRKMQLQQQQQHQHQQLHPNPQQNGESPSLDPPDPSSSPKPTNGVLSSPNGHVIPLSSSQESPAPNPLPTQQQPYAFAPPDDMNEQEIAHRRNVIFLIQQLCVMGKNVQLPARMALFRTLVDRGILFAVQWAIGLSEKEPTTKTMISAAGEVLAALLDHDLNGVRGHVLKQVVAIDKERAARKRGAEKAETIVELCCRVLASSKDLAVQSQIGDALKVWLDLPLGNDSFAAGGSEASQAIASKLTRKDDPGTERFMDYFYKDCSTILFKPFGELPDWRNVTVPIYPLTREQTNRYVYLCDLLYNFSLQHQFRSHLYLLSSNVVLKVATLLKAKEKHLRHSAFRVFRLLLKQNNHTILSKLMKLDILKPVLDLTIQESRRDNLLSCSCQEFFEHMRRENMKDMIRFCMMQHEAEIKTLAETPLGGQRFQMFIRRWEMNNEPLPVETKPDKPVDNRGWPIGTRAPEAEEEDYFNTDDDDDDYVPSISHSWSRGSGASSPIPGANGVKRKRRMAVAGALATRGITLHNRPPPRSPHLGSLVDYDDDEEPVSIDITVKDPSSSSPPAMPPSSPKLSHRQISLSPNGPPPKRLAPVDEDEEDNMLEALVSRSRPQSPGPGMMASMNNLGPMRPGEKRRRGNDDDDEELLARLSKSAKKPDLGKQKESPGGLSASLNNRAKTGDDPPKKFKLKIGTPKAATSSPTLSPSSTPVPSEPGAKDGDTG